MKTLVILTLSAVPILFTTLSSFGQITLTVGPGSEDFAHIQEALDAASEGDTIIVSASTYHETLVFPGFDIALRSTDPSNPTITATTILDASKMSNAVVLSGSETAACVLEGLTIQNGYGTVGNGSTAYGGGINGNGTHATIRYNVIQSNVVDNAESFWAGGGGIYDCDGLILGNIIQKNAVKQVCNDYYNASGDMFYGGALYKCDGEIRENAVIDNQIVQAGCQLYDWSIGAGISYCTGICIGNTITGNASAAQGGGIAAYDGVIMNNIITGNTAGMGAGLSGCGALVANNIIADNTGSSAVMSCGTLTHNTVYGNSGIGVDGVTAIYNSIIWANDGGQVSDAPVQYSCIQNWTPDSLGNISADPQLRDPAHLDFHLLASSPCIDAGTSGVTVAIDFERDGRPAGAGYDMGADEYAIVSQVGVWRIYR